MRRALGAAFAALCASLVLLSSVPAGADDPPSTDGWRAIEVEARPVDLDPAHPGPRRIGALIFRGGLELSAPPGVFGGLSGVWVGSDGRFLAVNDDGAWYDGRLEFDARGAPLGLSHVRTARLRDEAGAAFTTKADGDAEGLARLPDGRFAVSFEQIQRIRFYDLDRAGSSAPATAGPLLTGVDRLNSNAGLEAIAALPDGSLLIGAERGAGPDAPLWRVLRNAPPPHPRAAGLRLPFGHGLVGLDALPNGDLIAVQRFYAPVIGVRIRVVRIDARSLTSGAARAETLAALGPPLNLDNFESVAVLPLSDGGARLILVSDDNFAATQRTLLFVFDLPADEAERR